MNSQVVEIWNNVFSTKSLTLILIVFLLVQIGITVIHQYKLSGFEFVGIESISFTSGMYYKLYISRIIILSVSAIILVFIYLKIFQIDFNSIGGFLLLIALISQEIIGRMMFYQSYFRIGV